MRQGAMIAADSTLTEVLAYANDRDHKDCEACNHSCQMGAGVFAPGQEKEVATFLHISEHELEQKLEPITRFGTTLKRPRLLCQQSRPYGACVFWDTEKKCTINPVKPLECRTATCDPIGELTSQWFARNHFVKKQDPASWAQWQSAMRCADQQLPETRVPDSQKDDHDDTGEQNAGR